MLSTRISQVLKWTWTLLREVVILLDEVHERKEGVLFHEFTRGCGHLLQSLSEVVGEVTNIPRDRIRIAKRINAYDVFSVSEVVQE